MTECEYDGCTRDSVGIAVWNTNDEFLEREYCQKHLRDTKVDFPELIERTELV